MSSSPPSSSFIFKFVLQLNLLFLLISLCVMKRERDADSEEKIAERAEALRERFLLERREKRRKERVLVYKSLLRDVEEGVDIFALIQNPHEASLASPRLLYLICLRFRCQAWTSLKQKKLAAKDPRASSNIRNVTLLDA